MNKKIFIILMILIVLTSSFVIGDIEDTFDRSDSSTLGTATNGNVWGETKCDILTYEIVSNNFKSVSNGLSTATCNNFADIVLNNSNPTRIDFFDLETSSMDNKNIIIGTSPFGVSDIAVQLQVGRSSSSDILAYYSGSWLTSNYIVTAGVSFDLSLRNINYVSDTFDIYIDDVLKKTGATFRSNAGISGVRMNHVSSNGADVGSIIFDCLTTAGDSCDLVSVDNFDPSNNYHDSNTTIYFNANTTVLNSTSCELFLGVTSYGNSTAGVSNVIKGVTPSSDGSYEWYFDCDGTLSTSNSTFIYDTVNPIYTENTLNGNDTVYNKNISSVYEVEFTGNMTDNYLFAWNYTIYDSDDNIMFTNETINLTSSSETILHNIDIGNWNAGIYTQNVTISDDHTAKWIPDNMEGILNTRTFEIITDDVTFMIESSNGNLKDASFEYMIDRYNFGFDIQNAKSEWDFNLFCDEPLYYRGDLYTFPVFVCGSKWIDFNIAGSQPLNTIVTSLPNNAYNINFKFSEASNNIQFNSVGGLNIITDTKTFEVTDIPIVSFNDYIAYNSSGGVVNSFNSENLLKIENTMFSFNVDGGTSSLDSFTFNLTANGSGSCALGNKQSNQCYSYDNSSYQWIEFIENSLTNTFDDTNDHQGDYIRVNRTVINSSYWIVNISMDEHYNPNIFKNYDVEFNYSDIKYQDDVSKRITKNNLVKIINPNGFLYESADIYKLDFRVNNSPTPSNKQLHAHFCNSTYTTGDPDGNTNCVLIASLSSSDLIDDGTKYRALFTNDILTPIGKPTQLILGSTETVTSKYFALKTFKANNLSEGVRTSYSTDSGSSWVNATDGYESEANVNWFSDGASPTSIVFSYGANTLSSSSIPKTYTEIWNINATTLYDPLIDILYPINDEVIDNSSFPLEFVFEANDLNSDTLDVYYYIDGVQQYFWLNDANNVFYHNNTYLNAGDYNLTLTALKNSDNNYNSSITISFTITSLPLPPNNPIIYGECNNVTLGFNSSTPLVLNISTTSDPNSDNYSHHLFLKRGLISYDLNKNFAKDITIYNFSLNKTGLINGTYNYKIITTDDTNLSNTTTSSCEFDICINNWIANLTTCINDTQLKTYYDGNSCSLQYDIPSDNNTFISCNDFILTENEQTERNTMLIILFILFVLFVLLQLLQINMVITISSAMLNIMLGLGMFFIVDSSYIVVALVMIIFQAILMLATFKNYSE